MTWRRRLRYWWRVLLAVLRIRRFTPRPWERRPGLADMTSEGFGDTGGGGYYRPPHRKQDPAVDPREPGGGESSSRGEDHGWSGCTMTSAAMALAYAKQGGTWWGGDMRHAPGQPDQDGGTDLYDAQAAFEGRGESLGIRSGQGWDALKQDRAAGRFLIVQGEGNVPGSATFTGGHACALGPETNADGQWLWGDPLASGWQWVSPSAIRDWMEAWAGSGLAWARTEAHPPPAPEPEPEPPPAPKPQAPWDAGAALRDAREAGRVEALDAAFASWSPGRHRPPLVTWDAGAWGEDPWTVVPYPLEALVASRTPAAWDTWPVSWTGATWRDVTPAPAGGPPWGGVAWSAPWGG